MNFLLITPDFFFLQHISLSACEKVPFSGQKLVQTIPNILRRKAFGKDVSSKPNTERVVVVTLKSCELPTACLKPRFSCV